MPNDNAILKPSPGLGVQPAARLSWLDMARGIAVILMVIYHFSWDLSFHKFFDFDVNQVLGWRIFARGIAASFLFLAGFSLWLAHRNGFKAQAFWRREIILIAAAGLVSLGTWYAFPSSYVFFGILHCIAASSLIALLFLRLPGWVTLFAAVLVLVAPFTLANEAFNAPLLAFIGLRTVPPMTNDYVPLLPWLSPLLAGLAAGQLLPGLAMPDLGQVPGPGRQQPSICAGRGVSRPPQPDHLSHPPAAAVRRDLARSLVHAAGCQ